ncbi:hypothetical protein Fmac_016711 [Flemingia macrophylla]|uniref:Uncharacterized protein n=1 Tax=Flemingia macrophylla TaxID=520843 RepID=A0ABD1MI87_9FABA
MTVAVLKQFGAGGYGGSGNMVTDEVELQQHQILEKLYISTRAGKHYQRDIVRGVEGYIVTGSKQVEIGCDAKGEISPKDNAVEKENSRRESNIVEKTWRKVVTLTAKGEVSPEWWRC